MVDIKKFENHIEVAARTKQEAINTVRRDMSGYVYEEKIGEGPTYNLYVFRRSRK